jgi:hypothetical protein
LSFIIDEKNNKINTDSINIDDKDKIDDEILKEFEKTITVKKIKTLIKTHKFTPNIECLRRMSKKTTSKVFDTFEYLEKEYNLKPDYKCFTICIEKINKKQINFVLEKFFEKDI